MLEIAVMIRNYTIGPKNRLSQGEGW